MENKSLKELFQQTSFYTRSNNEFLGNLLQELDVRFANDIPTVGLRFNQKTSKFTIQFNSDYFLSMSIEQRAAVFIHELMHFTNGHFFRWEKIVKKEELKEKMQLLNIAADLAINQYINNLPNGCELCRDKEYGFECPNLITRTCVGRCLDVNQWVYIDEKKQKQTFPKYKTMECYYALLNDPKNQKANGEKFKQAKALDEHEWANLSDEEKERILKEGKRILERTIEKTTFGKGSCPDYVQDVLKEITTELQGLDYRGILKRAIKKTVAVTNRESTWYRPNKRYGNYAPGSTVGKLPKVDFFIDTSGSISYTEANMFLGIMSNFLRVGASHCNLGLWHDKLYYFEKYKKNQFIDPSIFQSGGTNQDAALEQIKETNPDLAIILTDGHTFDSKLDMTEHNNRIIWIISENGNKDHPNKNIGLTIPLGSIKN